MLFRREREGGEFEKLKLLVVLVVVLVSRSCDLVGFT